MNALELAGRLGLRKLKRDWRGKCPSCGYLAFTVRGRPDQDARVSCFSCNDAPSIAVALKRTASATWTAPAPGPSTSGNRQQWARDLWDRALPASDTPAALYLARRGLAGTDASPVLRYLAAVSHPQRGPKLPAMIARVQDVAGETIAVHRTYITLDGRKAGVEPAKASLGTIWGGATRLRPHEPSRPLVVAEGIESAASAGILLQAPAWAALSAGNMAKGMSLPPEVADVLIAADPDAPGETAALTAAERWEAEGRRVRIARLAPNMGDWNDALLREMAHG